LHLEGFLKFPTGNGFFKRFWIRRTAVSEAELLFRNFSGSETAFKFTAAACNGHSPTETSARSGETAMQRATAAAVGKSQPLHSGVGIFAWCHPSSPP
jgi:hypothetical protein